MIKFLSSHQKLFILKEKCLDKSWYVEKQKLRMKLQFSPRCEWKDKFYTVRAHLRAERANRFRHTDIP